MKHLKNFFWLAGILVLAVLIGGIYFLLSESGTKNSSESSAIDEDNLFRYQINGLKISLGTNPGIPRVGNNELIIEVRNLNNDPISVPIDAYAEMPAMGAMPAMRAPIDLKEITKGRYVGTMNLSMRGEWPLSVVIKDQPHGKKRLQFDLATDRKGLEIVAGATSLDGVKQTTVDANVITIDNRRRQLIGVETDAVTHRDLTKFIRAVGEVMFDEQLLSHVSVKFDGYIGDLKANYVGAKVQKNQILFTIYSPELLAAQQEYLETLKRRQNHGNEDGLLRAARQRLALWDMSPQQIMALEQRGSPQDYLAIYAPRSGTLIERNIADGSAVRKDQTLLEIVDLSRVWIEAEVFEADLELVQVGMAVTFTLPYLSGRTYPAVVEYIYPYLQSDSRTGRIRLSLENPDGVLKPDMYAEVSLQAELGRQLSIPEEAIIVAGDNRVVFVDLGEGRLKPILIKTGRNAQGYVEVLDGLSAGDIVVTSGNFLIAAETRMKMGLEQW
jgi:membrane fusion protein, copper/silver efflux system